MTNRSGTSFSPSATRPVFAASGYGARGGFGKRPALLVIDVNYAFCGDKPEPILESIKKWRNSCGEESWPAIAAIKTLIDKRHDEGHAGDLHDRHPPRRQLGFRLVGLEEQPQRRRRRLSPSPISTATRSSTRSRPARRTSSSTSRSRPASSAPTWRAICTLLGCDSVIVTGTTTSGCVRATVLDAFSLNYPRRAGRGRLLRPLAGEPRHQSLRHEREIRRRREDGRGARRSSTRCPTGMFDLPKGAARRSRQGRQLLRSDAMTR